jgi:hypothetical protein
VTLSGCSAAYAHMCATYTSSGTCPLGTGSQTTPKLKDPTGKLSLTYEIYAGTYGKYSITAATLSDDDCFSTSAFAYAETTDTTQTWSAGLANAAWQSYDATNGWQADKSLTVTCNV